MKCTNICVIYTRGMNEKSIGLQLDSGREKARSLGFHMNEMFEINNPKAPPSIEEQTSSAGLSQLIKMVREQQVHTVIVYSYDRLSRDLLELVEFVKLLNEFDVRLVVSNEQDKSNLASDVNLLLA